MNKSTSVIEINGKRYDAVTGQIIEAVKKVATRVSNPTSGLSIDGFTKHKSNIAAVTQKTKTSSKSVKPASADEPGTTWQATTRKIHRTTQRSQTLMRSVVRKPLVNPDATTRHAIAKKSKGLAIDPNRVAHAKATPKDSRVKRFGTNKSSSKAKNKAVASIGEVMPKRISQSGPATTVALSRPLPSMVASASHNHLERLLDQALVSADAHKKAWREQMEGNSLWHRATKVPKWMSIGVTILVILAVGGFFVWQNIPSVGVRVASIRNHIDATTPGYTPSGFSFAGLKDMSGGVVTIEYRANGDTNRSYAITQEKSNLNSTSLVATEKCSGSSQVKGKTVYICGDESHALWVDHGMKYTITDHANLNADQILKIAGSLN